MKTHKGMAIYVAIQPVAGYTRIYAVVTMHARMAFMISVHVVMIIYIYAYVATSHHVIYIT